MRRRKDPLDSIFPWGSDSDCDDQDERSRSPVQPKSLQSKYSCNGIHYSLLRGNAHAGIVLAHCMACIQQVRYATGGESLAIYKIGISHNCENRFELYKSNGWSKMVVMFESSDLGLVEMLEAALISHHRENTACRNILKGGEGLRDGRFNPKFDPPYFCYCTAARADVPRWVI